MQRQSLAVGFPFGLWFWTSSGIPSSHPHLSLSLSLSEQPSLYFCSYLCGYSWIFLGNIINYGYQTMNKKQM